jgi:hypothetical protein
MDLGCTKEECKKVSEEGDISGHIRALTLNTFRVRREKRGKGGPLVSLSPPEPSSALILWRPKFIEREPWLAGTVLYI